jgi:hypothetical protein
VPGHHLRRLVGSEAQPAELGRPAADIEDDGIGPVLVEQRQAALEGELGLFAGGDDVEAHAGFAQGPADEVGAIVGAAAGFSRDGTGERHTAARHLAGADLQGFEGPGNRRIGEPPGLGDAFP